MSDSARDFMAKVDRMFADAERQLVEICITYVVKIAWPLIDTTPGPNLQYPYDTEYIATGRLRAGWKLSLSPLSQATQWEGGPYTEHGDDTLALIEGELGPLRVLPLASLPRSLYLVNVVAYGYIVHWGLGRHSTARPWVENVANDVPRTAMAEARAEVMGR